MPASGAAALVHPTSSANQATRPIRVTAHFHASHNLSAPKI